MVNEGTDLIQNIAERAEAVGSVIGYDKSVVLPFPELFPDGKPIRHDGLGTVWDEELKVMRPDWTMVDALGRKWEKEVRAKELEELVRRYQAGDESVLSKIEKNLEALAYSMVKEFAFKPKTDNAVFVNAAGKFDKRVPRTEKLFVLKVPFNFTEDDIDEQFPKSVKAALKTYDPNYKNKKGKTTIFSTWFFRRFRFDLTSLYINKYKVPEPEKIMNMKQYKEKKLSWSRTYIPIPENTGFTLDDFSVNELDWMSLVLESLPYRLSVNLRCELLPNIKDRKTDKSIRDSLRKKVEKIRVPAEFVLYSERFRKWSYVWQGGRKWPRVSDGYVGDIVLNSGLLTVKGHADPTAVAVARAMDNKTELPKGTRVVPAFNYCYKDKDGLKLLPGATGECNQSSIYDLIDWVREHYQRKKQGREIPVTKPKELKPKYCVYNHTLKTYCENVATKWSIMMVTDGQVRMAIKLQKERERRKAFIEWIAAMELYGKIPHFLE